ncbi:hypothetical protein LLG07_02610, partial [bacterium]|nr:hypothetical protein [bacterium]
VLNNIKYMKELGVWVEITTLLIPGLNDSKKELSQIAEFLKSTGEEIPWHISAYYPQYKSKIPPTTAEKVMEAVSIGKSAGLKFVYGGNVSVDGLEDTPCPNCGNYVIKRRGFSLLKTDMNDGMCCNNCNYKIAGIF